MHASSRERRVQTDSANRRGGAPQVRVELQITRPLVVSAEWNGINVVRKRNQWRGVKALCRPLLKALLLQHHFSLFLEKAY